MKDSSLFALITLVLALLLLFFSTKEFSDADELIANGEHTNGIIIEVKKGPSSLSKYYPRIHFITKDGKEIEFVSSTGSNPSLYNVDDQVQIVYNYDDPKDAFINSFIEVWIASAIYAFMSFLLFIFSGFLWIKSRSG
ncbi:MAG: DUF3592 domain-containing protein [Sulfurimonas sp.]|nr:DUF3592 domain-containing protein [Sulfurimonas sp.]